MLEVKLSVISMLLMGLPVFGLHPPQAVGVKAGSPGRFNTLCAVGDSALEKTANLLQPGQSVQLTTPLTAETLELPQDKSTFIQWGSSAVWDPKRREVRFIGKRDAHFPYRFLTYNVDANTWDNTRKLPPPLDTGSWGHGYDHNAADPATGDSYFRQFGSNTIFKWNGSWEALPPMPGHGTKAASITWFPGIGLVYTDTKYIQYFDGTKWTRAGESPVRFGLHSASEYNRVANVVIFGGGNDSDRAFILDKKLTVKEAATPPFNIGASSSQSVLVSDPRSANFITWKKYSAQWARYDATANSWSPLTQSAGDGSTPQAGTPNLENTRRGGSTVGVSIDDYNVMMFIQYLGENKQPAVWLYKHSK